MHLKQCGEINVHRTTFCTFHMDPRELVSENLKFYDTIKAKNPPDSYTVIASLNDYVTGQLLCLATGTQANLKSCHDDIQDCHAESLVKRAYKRYVIDKLNHILTDCDEKTDLRKQIPSHIPQNVILFISKFPCGFLTRYEGQEPVDPSTGDAIKRKPGRGTVKDGKILYVEKESCFLKLRRWLKDGIQGTKLQQNLGIETRIKTIVIGDSETDEHFDYQLYLRDFSARLRLDQYDVQVHHVNQVRRDDFIFRPSMTAQPVSVVWWRMIGSVPNNNCEMIVDGRKRGLTKQHRSSGLIDPSWGLKVADAKLRNDLADISTMYMN